MLATLAQRAARTLSRAPVPSRLLLAAGAACIVEHERQLRWPALARCDTISQEVEVCATRAVANVAPAVLEAIAQSRPLSDAIAKPLLRMLRARTTCDSAYPPPPHRERVRTRECGHRTGFCWGLRSAASQTR